MQLEQVNAYKVYAISFLYEEDHEDSAPIVICYTNNVELASKACSDNRIENLPGDLSYETDIIEVDDVESVAMIMFSLEDVWDMINEYLDQF
jgi:hypothetical protein